MEKVDLLVQADWLYPMSEGLPVIRGGEVAIRGDRIVHAGPAREAGAWDAARTVARRGSAVLPGFVNCHSHAASPIFRSQTDDDTGGLTLAPLVFRMEKDVQDEEWRLLGELGCIDLIRAGVTTINDIWYNPWALAETVERAGLRAQIANKVFDVRLEELYRNDYTRHPAVGERRLRDGIDFVEHWHGRANGRITGRIGTHASDTCRAGLHREALGEARRLGVGMHIHAAQNRQEVALIQAEQGCGPLEYLRDIGLLGPDIVLAHMTYASDADLDAVAETGARYAHCPTIYARRGRYPRVEAILERGITTGFGTDWMLNDPFAGMRNAINAMRLRLADPDFLPCRQALWFHTMGAARVLGLDHEIGSLEPGKKADLIMVDLEKPHLQPYYGGYQALVFYANGTDVTTSIIDGQVVLDDGRITRLDEARALAETARQRDGWGRRLAALGSPAVVLGCGCCG